MPKSRTEEQVVRTTTIRFSQEELKTLLKLPAKAQLHWESEDEIQPNELVATFGTTTYSVIP